MKKYFVFPLIIITLYSCDSSSESKEAIKSVDLEIIEVAVIEKSKECDTESTKGCALLNVTYPIFKSKTDKATNAQLKPLNNAIYSIFSQTFIDFIPQGNLKATDNLDQLKAGFFNKHKKNQLQYKEVIGFELINKVTVPFFNEQYASVAQDQLTFAGGAHPDAELLYYTVDFKTGKNLNSLSWIADTIEVKRMLLAVLKNKMQIEATSDLEENGFFISDQELIITPNILIEKDTISFAYNSYEIAPYSYGIFNLKLPKSAVKLKN
jgi:hypothetical protein